MKNFVAVIALLALTGCVAEQQSYTDRYPHTNLAKMETMGLCLLADMYPNDAGLTAEMKKREYPCYPIEGFCRKYANHNMDKFEVCVKGRTNAMALGARSTRRHVSGSIFTPNASQGTTVYSASQCTGPIVAGVCHGGIIPNPSLQRTCHGEMLPNGQCTGPLTP